MTAFSPMPSVFIATILPFLMSRLDSPAAIYNLNSVTRTLCLTPSVVGISIKKLGCISLLMEKADNLVFNCLLSNTKQHKKGC